MLGRIFGKNKTQEVGETDNSLKSKIDSQIFADKLRAYEEHEREEAEKKAFFSEREVPEKINYRPDKPVDKLKMPGINALKVMLLGKKLSELVVLTCNKQLLWRYWQGEEWKNEDLLKMTSNKENDIRIDEIHDIAFRGNKLVVACRDKWDLNFVAMEKRGEDWMRNNLVHMKNERFVSMCLNKKGDILTMVLAGAKNKFEIVSWENKDNKWQQKMKRIIISGNSYTFVGDNSEKVLCSNSNMSWVYLYRDWYNIKDAGEKIDNENRILQADFVGKNKIVAIDNEDRLIVFSIAYTSKGKKVEGRVIDQEIKKIGRGSWKYNCLLGLKDGRFLTGSDDGKVRIWKKDSREIWIVNTCIPDGQSNRLGSVNDIRMLSDGRVLTVDDCGDESSVRIWKGSDKI